MAWPWLIGAAVVALGAAIAGSDSSSSEESTSSSEDAKRKFKKEKEQNLLGNVDKSLARFFETHSEILQFHSNSEKKIYKELVARVVEGCSLSSEYANMLDFMAASNSPDTSGFEPRMEYVRKASQMAIDTAESVEDALDNLYGQDAYHCYQSEIMDPCAELDSGVGAMREILGLSPDTSAARHVVRISPDLMKLFLVLHQLEGVREHCNDIENKVAEDALVGRARQHADFAETLQQWCVNYDAMDDAPRVIVCGMLKAGKSTLLNMLTEHFTDEYFPSARTRKTVAINTLEYSSICYVDTPGLDAPEDDEKTTWSAMASAEHILFVHNIANEFEDKEIESLRRLVLLRPDFAQICTLVGTYAETRGIAQDKRQQALEMLQKRFQDITQVAIPTFLVSNTSYMKGCLEGKNNLRKSAGIDALKEALRRGLDRAKIKEERVARLQNLQNRLAVHVSAEIEQIREAIELAQKKDNIALQCLIKDMKALLGGFKMKIAALDKREG